MEVPPRIGLIADDDAYFRMAVGTILIRNLGFTEVQEAASLDDALLRMGGSMRISAALFGLSMPGMKSPANLRTVRECFPDTRIAVISGSSSRRSILLALEAGVHGYMPKSLEVADLTAALQVVLDGGIYVPPCLADISSSPQEPAARFPELAEPALSDAANALTPRQQEVLALLVQGKTNKEIASILRLGKGTVKIHLAAIFRHFGVSNRAAAAVAGARVLSVQQPL